MKTTCWQIRVLSVSSNIHKLEIGKQDDVEEQVSLLTLKHILKLAVFNLDPRVLYIECWH